MNSAREAGAKLFRREYDLEGTEESQKPIARLCAMMLADAMRSRALRIRIEGISAELGGIEYEIAGQWQPVAQIPVQAFRTMINRFKVMASLDIGRVPVQEGELHVRLDGVPRVLKIRTEATGAPYENVMITVP